jgi:hypothetical protein
MGERLYPFSPQSATSSKHAPRIGQKNLKHAHTQPFISDTIQSGLAVHSHETGHERKNETFAR